MFGRHPAVNVLKRTFKEFRDQPVSERKNHFPAIQDALKEITSKIDDVKLHQSCLSLIDSCKHMTRHPPPAWFDEETEIKFVEEKIAEIARRVRRA